MNRYYNHVKRNTKNDFVPLCSWKGIQKFWLLICAFGSWLNVCLKLNNFKFKINQYLYLNVSMRKWTRKKNEIIIFHWTFGDLVVFLSLIVNTCLNVMYSVYISKSCFNLLIDSILKRFELILYSSFLIFFLKLCACNWMLTWNDFPVIRVLRWK